MARRSRRISSEGQLVRASMMFSNPTITSTRRLCLSTLGPAQRARRRSTLHCKVELREPNYAMARFQSRLCTQASCIPCCRQVAWPWTTSDSCQRRPSCRKAAAKTHGRAGGSSTNPLPVPASPHWVHSPELGMLAPTSATSAPQQGGGLPLILHIAVYELRLSLTRSTRRFTTYETLRPVSRLYGVGVHLPSQLVVRALAVNRRAGGVWPHEARAVH
jgi:hypothetical protein